jgi:hypothetical protein
MADMLYLIKAKAPLNTEAHSYVQGQILNGKVKFLIDENQAKVKLMSTKVGQQMDINKREEYLKPYTETTILREQMLNLAETNEGQNILLKQSNKKIPKDKFSAFEYGMYYIKVVEEGKKRRRRGGSVADMMFYS